MWVPIWVLHDLMLVLWGHYHHVNVIRAIAFIICCIACLPFDMDCGMELTLNSYKWKLGSRKL